jgi:DNA polymerase-3 subunit delta
MILTLTGANTHQRNQELAHQQAAFIAAHDDMAVERLDGEEATVDRMREALQSMPFLSERKMVILREPSKQKAFTEAIADILGDIPETTDVIIHEPKLDKRLSYYKTLKKQTEFKEFTELDSRGLSTWAVEYAKAEGGTISTADASLLVERVGSSQQTLQNELDKLVLYAPAITRETIELLTERLPQSTIFELLDAAFGGNKQRVFSLYAEQRALKVEPQAIIAMLAWQLHILAVIKAASTRSVDEIAKETKLNPFVIRKSQGLTRRLEIGRIKRLIADLLQLDIRLKTISIDADEALQNYLLTMVQ